MLDRLRGELPPLVGVIHGAAALADGLLANLGGADVATAAAPKAHGAWTLHRLTESDPLEFFVLLSSTASTLGHPGQGSYAAANAFVDGLAAYRRARGLPATVVAWGPWSRVGGVAERGLEERFRSRGLGAIDPEEGVAALAALLEADAPAATVVRLDADRYRRAHPYAAQCLLPAPEGTAGAIVDAVADAATDVDWTAALQRGDGEARSLVLAEVRRAMAGVYGVPEASLAADVTFAELSFDSLMALQLRNLLERRLGLSLPATLVWNYPAPASLADHLVERLASELLEDAPR
jgi:acyl carrier protein